MPPRFYKAKKKLVNSSLKDSDQHHYLYPANTVLESKINNDLAQKRIDDNLNLPKHIA